MTPEERKSMIQGMIVELLADVRHAAIAEEREACAKTVLDCKVPAVYSVQDMGWDAPLERAAAAIRARGKP